MILVVRRFLANAHACPIMLPYGYAEPVAV